MNTTEIANEIANLVKTSLPGCGVWFYRNGLTQGAINLTVTVGQNTDEFNNGIRQNDPLTLSFWIWSESDITMECSLSIKTTKPYMYSESAKLRKQTMKTYNIKTVNSYLQKVKQLILNNQPNWLDVNKELLAKRFCDVNNWTDVNN